MARAAKPEQNGAAPTHKGTLTPFKVICQVVAAHCNEKGEVIGEMVLGNQQGPTEIILYKPDFDKLPEKLAQAWEGVEEAFFTQQER